MIHRQLRTESLVIKERTLKTRILLKNISKEQSSNVGNVYDIRN